MEKQKAGGRSEFGKKWKLNEVKGALGWVIGSIGLMVGALSISLVGYAEASELESVRVKATLNDGSVTIDPDLQLDESLLVTVPDSPYMMGQSVRMADGRLEPPFVGTLDVPVSVWESIAYLLTKTGAEIEEWECRVVPETIEFEEGVGRYELECVDN